MAYTTIDDPSAFFQVIRWTGNDVDGRALTNDGNSDLQPDFIWLKAEVGYSHFLVDSSRGVTKYLFTDVTDAETTATKYVTSFNTDGFTVGDDGSQVFNHTGNIFDAWQWKCNGGTTSTNSDGDINSTVQVNQDAGFSIVTYNPSNTTARNIGHGLGATPSCIIIRNRTRVENPRFWHKSIGDGGAILDNTSAYNSSTSTLVNTVNSTIFNVGTDFSVNGNYPIVAWCWAEKQGYSKFGKYIGNGNADGPFIYTGFKPAFILFKKSSDAGDNWMMYDHKRPGYNETTKAYYPNSNASESTSTNNSLDFLSNGFKLRSSFGAVNQNTNTYMYMAFAENPFVTSTGIPTTAR
jgi:hypothetical protein|tara:strand:+ start:1409 stop:2458 length:1050 start_codon:yes stop_codon:yes gene_type:complete